MTAYRVSPGDRPGTLFKQPSPSRERRKDLGRHPRVRDEDHLAALRECCCLVCRRWPVEAAHVRMSAPGKFNAGIGAKPDDKDTLPLCAQHHAEQHNSGEWQFYQGIGIDALKLAAALYRVSPNVQKMREIVLAHHVIVVIHAEAKP